MAIEIRALSSADSVAVNHLVSDAFGYISPNTFFDDFPIWDVRNHSVDSKKTQLQSLGLYQDSKLVSHVGARVTNLIDQEKSYRVGIIGAVATDPLARGNGYSTQLLNQAIEWLKPFQVDWIFLWGSEHEFYKKLGFELAGQQCRAFYKDFSSKNSSTISSVSVQSGFNLAIFDALKKQNGIQLQDDDLNWVQAHKTIEWYSTQNPFSFVGYQRGLDLKSIVHEFGGSKAGLSAIFQKLFQLDPDLQLIGSKSTLTEFGFSNNQLIFENLCLAKTINANIPFPDQLWINGIGAS
jgi:GNAT superfamily N-acetyltransferase